MCVWEREREEMLEETKSGNGDEHMGADERSYAFVLCMRSNNKMNDDNDDDDDDDYDNDDDDDDGVWAKR